MVDTCESRIEFFTTCSTQDNIIVYRNTPVYFYFLRFTMSTVTQNLAAMLEKPGSALKPLIKSIPSPGENEILIRNHAIAANPVDWKIRDFGWHIDVFPTVLGSDVCGVVSAVGPNVTEFQVGDRIAGFAMIIANKKPEHGAWQTYTVLQDIATMRIPDSLDFVEGATFPMAFATASVALFERLMIARPVVADNQNSVEQRQQSGILIWGASSSTGTAAVQLAKDLGFKVFATASVRNHDYVKSLGAFEVVDYRDPDVVAKLAQLAEKAQTPLRYAFDSVAEKGIPALCAAALLKSGGQGGKLVSTGPWPADQEKPDGIEFSMTIAAFAFTAHAEMGRWLFHEYLPQAIQEKRIVPAPKVVTVDGGVAAAQEALEMVKTGVSAAKVVVKVN